MQFSGFHLLGATGSVKSWEFGFLYAVEISLWWDPSLKIYSAFSFLQEISFIFNQGGLHLPFTTPLVVLSLLTAQIFLWDGLMQFLLAQILNNSCAISSLAMLFDDADAPHTWKAASELRAKSCSNAILTLYKTLGIDNTILCTCIKRIRGVSF